MSAPKSIVKINKTGVQYTSSVDKANYYLFELTRGALRDVGKFVRKTFQAEYYNVFQRHTGEGPKAISYKVWSARSTEHPRVDIGIQRNSPGKVVKGWYMFYLLRGTKHIRQNSLLEDIVKNNTAQIIDIESQYLTGLEDEAAALQKLRDVSEGDMEEEADT